MEGFLVAEFGCDSMLTVTFSIPASSWSIPRFYGGKGCTWIGTGNVIETEPNRIESRLPMVFTVHVNYSQTLMRFFFRLTNVWHSPRIDQPIARTHTYTTLSPPTTTTSPSINQQYISPPHTPSSASQSHTPSHPSPSPPPLPPAYTRPPPNPAYKYTDNRRRRP
jgi:hypothetical protein